MLFGLFVFCGWTLIRDRVSTIAIRGWKTNMTRTNCTARSSVSELEGTANGKGGALKPEQFCWDGTIPKQQNQHLPAAIFRHIVFRIGVIWLSGHTPRELASPAVRWSQQEFAPYFCPPASHTKYNLTLSCLSIGLSWPPLNGMVLISQK